MPNQPRDNNKAHTVRVSDELWAKVTAEAERRGESVSEATRRFYEQRYLKGR